MFYDSEGKMMSRNWFRFTWVFASTMLLIANLGTDRLLAQQPGGGVGGSGGSDSAAPDFLVVDFDNSGTLIGAYIPGIGIFDGPNADLDLFDCLSICLTQNEYSDFEADFAYSAGAAVNGLSGRPEFETAIGFFDFQNGESWSGFSSSSELAYQQAATFEAELSNSNISGTAAYLAISKMLLGKKGSGHHSTFSNVIVLVDSNGTTHYPTNGGGLVDVLEDIRDDGETVVTLIIKGHGSEDLIEVGNDGDILTVVNNQDIVIGNLDPNQPQHDITELLDDVTDSGTTINFRGCSTAPLAASVDVLIGGDPTTTGTLLPVVNVPWTPFYVGPYYSY